MSDPRIYIRNHSFTSKPRHVPPQINCLGKTSPVLRISTHMYVLSKEIDGKMFIFKDSLGMETPQIDCLGYMSPLLSDSNTHL